MIKEDSTINHLDHRVSIYYGFHNDIPADDIASVNNLKMIPWKENFRKGINSIFEQSV
jgi:hypothetical protein